MNSKARRVLVFLLVLSGCESWSLQQKRSLIPPKADPSPTSLTEFCLSLDSKVTGWTATSIVVGALSGSSGLTVAALPDETPKWVMGSISLALSGVAALSAFMSTHYAAQYAKACTVQ